MNEFLVFDQNQDFYSKIVQHAATSADELKRRLDAFLTIDSELDLYHLILKHGRGCDYPLCAALVHFDAMQHLLITVSHTSYALLVCRIDLIKNSPFTLSQDTLRAFLTWACPLWLHEKIYMRRKSMELCKRIIPLLEDLDLSPILQYMHTCRQSMTLNLDTFQSLEYTEFFYNSSDLDRECLKLLIQIGLSVLLYHPTLDINTLFTQDLSNQAPSRLKSVLFETCCANDDDTVELLDIILSIYQQKHASVKFLQSIDITPHSLILYFLYTCGNTHAIIIDLLLDNDSDFLAWFHRYIRFAIGDIANLRTSLKDDTFLTIIANTILALEGGGFPYNTDPLVRRLVQLEELLSE